MIFFIFTCGLIEAQQLTRKWNCLVSGETTANSKKVDNVKSEMDILIKVNPYIYFCLLLL